MFDLVLEHMANVLFEPPKLTRHLERFLEGKLGTPEYGNLRTPKGGLYESFEGDHTWTVGYEPIGRDIATTGGVQLSYDEARDRWSCDMVRTDEEQRTLTDGEVSPRKTITEAVAEFKRLVDAIPRGE